MFHSEERHFSRAKSGSFQLEGRFLGFLLKDGYKLKSLKIATAEGEYLIKLSKELRHRVPPTLAPGTWVQVSGEFRSKKGYPKLKADFLTIAVPSSVSHAASPVVDRQADLVHPSANVSQSADSETKPAKAKILVCQKSDCWKRGGKAVCKALEAELSDRGMADQVSIKGTGCMKQCKAGPNLIVMPDKTRYSKVRANDVPQLVDRHFSAPSQ